MAGRRSLMDDGTALFSLCLSLRPGQCIDVDGEQLRRAEMSNSGDYHRQPLPHEMKAYLAQIQENWEVTITEKFGGDQFTIYKRHATQPERDGRGNG